jgi:hypothetical protein
MDMWMSAVFKTLFQSDITYLIKVPHALSECVPSGHQGSSLILTSFHPSPSYYFNLAEGFWRWPMQLIHPRNSILNSIYLVVITSTSNSSNAIEWGDSLNHARLQHSSFLNISFHDTFWNVIGRPQIRRHLWHYLCIHETLCWLVMHTVFFKLLLELSV